ncbi:unnamed protein product [Prunus brigantina]
MPSAPLCPTASVGQASAPIYDCFPPHQTTNQAPYRTTPAVSTPYVTGDKRMDCFSGDVVEPIGSIQLPIAIDTAPEGCLSTLTS